jgi:hypothetical protein
MNIAIGKIGKSIIFDSTKWGLIGGDEMAPILYSFLAEKYPQHKFYILGQTDIDYVRPKAALGKHQTSRAGKTYTFEYPKLPDNLISVESMIDKSVLPTAKERAAGDPTNDPAFQHRLQYRLIADKLMEIPIDFGIFVMGPTGAVNIPCRSKIIGSERIAITLQMFANYAGPIFEYLNMSGIPWFHLSEDPRYLPPTCRDLFNIEKFSLSQINGKFQTKRYQDYEHQTKFITKDVEYIYSMIETIFLIKEKKIDFRNMNKTGGFIMGINEGGKRGEIIEQWLLRYNKDIQIFGKWEESWHKKYPNNFKEVRIAPGYTDKYGFKENASDEFLNAKYTLIIGMKNPKFVTQKFWKMIHMGIIPFFHPDYDIDRIFKVPTFLRVRTPKQMWERIAELENNETLYREILSQLYDMLDDSLFNGEQINKVINESVVKLIGKSL